MPRSCHAIPKNGRRAELLSAAKSHGRYWPRPRRGCGRLDFLPRGLMRIDEREPKR